MVVINFRQEHLIMTRFAAAGRRIVEEEDTVRHIPSSTFYVGLAGSVKIFTALVMTPPIVTLTSAEGKK